MTALSRPQLKLEMDLTGTGPATAPTYTDYSAYLRVQDGVDWQRGRQAERSDVAAGTASFTLNNDAGTFTGKQLRAPVRLSIRFDDSASYTVVWTGYVSAWERGWDNGVRATMNVRATDAVTLLEKQALGSAIQTEILKDTPVAYWPLLDASGSTTAADATAVVGRPTMAVTQLGTGGTMDFGAASSLIDADTVAVFTPADVDNGKYLTTVATTDWIKTAAITVEVTLKRATGAVSRNAVLLTGPNDRILSIGTDGSGKVQAVSVQAVSKAGTGDAATATGGTVLTENAWYHVVVVTTASGGVTLYLNGVSDGTASHSGSYASNTVDAASIGMQYASGDMWDGSVSHVAVYTSALSSARVTAHYQAVIGGYAGERSDTRFVRVAGYSVLTPATPSTGSATMGTQQVKGFTVWQVLNDVATAEAGVAYVKTDGSPNLAVRSQRYGQAAAATFQARDVDPGTRFVLDDTYLTNDVTVTRVGGIAARAVNTGSVTKYGTQTETFTVNYDTDAQADYLAQWLANILAEPRERIGSLAIDVTAKAATVTQTTVAALDVSSLIRLTISATNYDLVIEGLQDRVDLNGWRRTLNVSPNYISQAWVLEDSTYGVLDTTTVLGF